MLFSSTISNVRLPAAALGLLAAASLLAGCATYTGDMLPHSMGGLPANAPARLAEPPPFPAVHDMPPPRTNSVLTEDERRKAEDDLVAARERQPGRTKAATPAKAAGVKAAPPKASAPKSVPAKLEKERTGASRSP